MIGITKDLIIIVVGIKTCKNMNPFEQTNNNRHMFYTRHIITLRIHSKNSSL